MLMLMLSNVSIVWPLNYFGRDGLKHRRDRTMRCLRAGGNGAFDLPEDGIQLSKFEPEAKQSEILRLFSEAQENILYLNKQRITAIEELNKLKKQQNLLLGRIQQLESESLSGSQKDKLSQLWELLLRIDSMVLSNLVSSEEALDYRRVVVDNKLGIFDIFTDVSQRSDAQILAELRSLSEKNKRNGLHIIHICTEMQPLVSVSPLASYITGLSCAMQGMGHLVEVVLPKYSKLQLDEVHGLREIDGVCFSYFNGQLHENRIWTGVVNGIGVTLIQPLSYSSFFNREKLYGYSDDFERFSYFSRASLDYIAKSGKRPDVLHIHNWETSIVGPLFWDIFVKQGLESTRVLLTCQGFDSQCLAEPSKLALCGLDPNQLNRLDRLQDNKMPNLVNILKGGIVYSNKVVLMSPMNSKGRMIYGLSLGLEPTLKIHKEKVLLSPFGFDNSAWDPSADIFLPENYSAEDMKGKSVCKVALQKQLGLSEQVSTAIVTCLVFEFSDGDIENLKASIRGNYKKDVQFVLIGTNEVQTNKELGDFVEEFEGGRMKLVQSYDEALSHLAFAGSDIILCEYLKSPMVETLLKALKYGAAPIEMTCNNNKLRHFKDDDLETTKFSQFISSTFGNVSLSEALDLIISNPLGWKRKIKEAMSRDFTWNAECYEIHASAYTCIKNL